MAMVEIDEEETVSFESRYVYSGSTTNLQWVHQTRKVTTTTTRAKGDKSDVESWAQSKIPSNYTPSLTSKKSYTIRKIDGPWWEADFTDEVAESWATDNSSQQQASS